MSNKIKIPMYEEQLTTLAEYYDDKPKESLHKFFFDIIVNLSKNAKDSLLSRNVSANILIDGKLTPKDHPLKSVDLEQYALVSDPTWRPKDFDKEHEAFYDLSVGDKFHNNIMFYCKIYNWRIDQYNDSIPMIKDLKNPEKQIKDPQFRALEKAACLEDIIHKSLIQPLAAVTDKAIQEIFAKEDETVQKLS